MGYDFTKKWSRCNKLDEKIQQLMLSIEKMEAELDELLDKTTSRYPTDDDIVAAIEENPDAKWRNDDGAGCDFRMIIRHVGDKAQVLHVHDDEKLQWQWFDVEWVTIGFMDRPFHMVVDDTIIEAAK